MQTVKVQSRGRLVAVPAVEVGGFTVVSRGRWVKVAAIRDEELMDTETANLDPELCISALRKAGMRADIFTFEQKLPSFQPKYTYPLEWDNVAAIAITSFADWHQHLPHDVKKALRRSAKMGLVVKVTEFTDELVEGIKRIYDESPVRQGKPFWHYQKDFETVKRENSTYLDRSTFIGAFYNNELIGFIRMIRVGTAECTLQVISQQRHFDKKPTNALLAKAVEVCEERHASHLVYGRYTYNGVHSSLTEFKRRNGFAEVPLPRYYVPLSTLGRLALTLGFHKPVSTRVPPWMLTQLIKLKGAWNSRRMRTAQATDTNVPTGSSRLACCLTHNEDSGTN
jgi:hypothetical protein